MKKAKEASTIAIIAAALALAASAPCAETATTQGAEPPDGGIVRVNGAGRLAIVNTCGADDEALRGTCRKIGNLFMIAADVRRGAAWSLAGAAEAFAGADANAAVFVVKDSALPISLVAMEARWGVVNAEGMDAKLLDKEILRVAIVLLGGASSKYPASTMQPAFSIADLEKVGELVTIDSLMAIFPNLGRYGFRQFEVMSFREACEEGYDVTPENDEQRRIAEEVKSAKK